MDELHQLLRRTRASAARFASLALLFMVWVKSGGSAATAQEGLPRPDHTVIVMEENKSFTRIIGAPGAPYINELAARGALFTSYFAIRHPSQPNYLALFSGSTQGVGDDSCPHRFNTPNLASELLGAGLTFAGYSESMPRPGYHGCSAGAYQRKHNPWVNFGNVPDDVNLPWTSFPADLAALPTVAIVVPNQNNDMHDGSVARGDSWLRENLAPYIEWAQTHNSLFILTWDEGNPSIENRIVTIFVGPMVQPGAYSERLNHYSLLRTLLSMYGLPAMAKAAEADPITSAWTAQASSFPVAVTLTSPADDTSVAGPTSLELVAEASANNAAIARVEFFDRGTKLGEVTTPPYRFTITNLTVADHSFAARATDELGRKKVSATARLHVFNPFLSWQGTYQGLVANPDSPSPETSGSFALKLDARGSFTAKLVSEGKSYRFTERFDRTGAAKADARLSANARWECALQAGFTNGVGTLQGELFQVTVNDAGQPVDRIRWAMIVADRVRERSATNALAEAGRHTLILLGEGDGAQAPGGHGFAQVIISSSGAVRASGRMAEGSVLSVSSALTELDRWPVYQRLNTDGALLGWVWFTNGETFASTEMGGELAWMRRGGGAKHYAAGFTNVLSVLGSAYLAPRNAGSRILPWTSGIFELDGAGILPPLTTAVQLDAVGRVEGTNITVQIAPRTGTWKAKRAPAGGISTLEGAVLQSRAIGLGYFLGPGGSGRARFGGE